MIAYVSADSLCQCSFSGYIIFTKRHVHTFTHRPETLDPSRCPSVGVICVTPPLTPVCDSSPLITHTSALAHGSWGAPQSI